MSKRILFIQGHPDASQPHLCHALASQLRRHSALICFSIASPVLESLVP
jgi:hypothetical protein